MLSRALVEMFRRPNLAGGAALQGGTALHKLYFDPPARYSEDLDLVQREAGPIGPLIDEIRLALDPWLGEPKWKVGQGRFTLTYRFETTFEPVVRMRAKVEINTREHFAADGFRDISFDVSSPWFADSAGVLTYSLPELLGTKLRALYQRKKGRDLFDLWTAAKRADVSPDRVVRCFERSMREGGHSVSRAQFERNLAEKREDESFRTDIGPLLRPETPWDFDEAFHVVRGVFVSRLSGEPWRSPSE